MPNDVQTFILHFLNDKPFNFTFTPLQFDQIPPNQLLQILSDVLCWIFQTENIDIRRESAEDTAIRLLNLLRILRYRPPVDPTELEEWRAGIVEGSKSCLYPLLVFLFENSEALKERAYLAKFLMKTEVPSEVHDYDTAELQNIIAELQNEFKAEHSDLKVIETDVILLLEDIKEDLKSMEKEKQLLIRKIEKAGKKVKNIPYFEKHMEVASHLRNEKDRIAEYTMQKHQERQKLVHAENRANRLRATLDELLLNADNLDQSNVMEKLEEEVATNKYLVNEKLAEDLKTRELKLKELSSLAISSKITENDIEKLHHQIEEVSKKVKDLEEEREHIEEDIDENMSIFRHQVTALERKKETAVQKLQIIRQDLAKLQQEVDHRKTQLQKKVGGEVLSTVQYKKHVDVFRARNEEHRRKRKELNDMFAEKSILKRTVEILVKRYDELRSHIENIGEEVVEVLHVPQISERPKTAAPATNNSQELKDDMKTMMTTLDKKKDKINDKKLKKDELKSSTMKKSEELKKIKENKQQKEVQMKENNQIAVEQIKDMEEQLKKYTTEISLMKNELGKLLQEKNILQQYSGTNDFSALEEQYETLKINEQKLTELIEGMGSLETVRMQAELWKNLLKIFEIKTEDYKGKIAAFLRNHR